MPKYHRLVATLSFLILCLVHLFKTKFWLRLRSAGEHHEQQIHGNVYKMRYLEWWSRCPSRNRGRLLTSVYFVNFAVTTTAVLTYRPRSYDSEMNPPGQCLFASLFLELHKVWPLITLPLLKGIPSIYCKLRLTSWPVIVLKQPSRTSSSPKADGVNYINWNNAQRWRFPRPLASLKAPRSRNFNLQQEYNCVSEEQMFVNVKVLSPFLPASSWRFIYFISDLVGSGTILKGSSCEKCAGREFLLNWLKMLFSKRLCKHWRGLLNWVETHSVQLEWSQVKNTRWILSPLTILTIKRWR